MLIYWFPPHLWSLQVTRRLWYMCLTRAELDTSLITLLFRYFYCSRTPGLPNESPNHCAGFPKRFVILHILLMLIDGEHPPRRCWITFPGKNTPRIRWWSHFCDAGTGLSAQDFFGKTWRQPRRKMCRWCWSPGWIFKMTLWREGLKIEHFYRERWRRPYSSILHNKCTYI